MFQYFTFSQIFPFFVSVAFFIASIITFQIDKKRLALYLLFFASSILGYFIANLDGFLNLWDEQYHALVAKNMLENPFKPTLYANPVFDYDYKLWIANHVWLHKQPLFLWQIALSIKLIGVNVLAVRMPSIIMHALTSIMIYKIGKIVYKPSVGFYAALFFSVAYFPLELITGKYPTDHNDIAFLFYVTASIWAWFEYQSTQKKYWIILIGLFSGCAILVKWLVGLLVYSIWFVSLGVENKRNWIKIKSYYPMFIALLVCILVFLPWQLYILYRFPIEALHEYKFNSQHLFHVIEGHGGNLLFHFNALKQLYGSGDAMPFILLIGLFVLIKNVKTKTYKVVIIASISIVYFFYSLAATKMIAFCMIVAPFFFLGMASIVETAFVFLSKKINNKYILLIISSFTLIIICFFLIRFSKIENFHTDKNPKDNCNRIVDIKQMKLIDNLNQNYKNNNLVIFNSDIRLHGHISVMYFTNHIAYNFTPNENQVNKMKEMKLNIAILDNDSLPEFIKMDNKIQKIKLIE